MRTKIPLLSLASLIIIAYMRDAKIRSDSVGVISIMEMPNGGASDVTLKKQVNEVTTAKQLIRALRPVTWYWKSDHQSDHLQYGFIAQEVEKVFPELVSTKKWHDGTSRKTVKAKALLPYLVKAFKEQQQQIEALEQEIKAIKKARHNEQR